jgi:hypothetical protein
MPSATSQPTAIVRISQAALSIMAHTLTSTQTSISASPRIAIGSQDVWFIGD